MISKFFFAVLLFSVTFLLFGVSRSFAQKDNYKVMTVEILKYVNEHRKEIGRSTLTMNDIISSASEKHSKNMASGKLPFGHDGFDERMNKIAAQLKPANAFAENVAYGARTAKEVVDQWLHSPGHKKNIEGDYNLTGIGVAKGADGTLYYTQIFIYRGDQ